MDNYCGGTSNEEAAYKRACPWEVRRKKMVVTLFCKLVG